MSRAPALRPALKRSVRNLLCGTMGALVALAPAAHAQQPMGLIRDAEIERILRADADPILVAAGLQPRNVELHIVGDKSLNAFVAGGQHLFLNTGLIVKTETPGQLIGVIAHETGHIARGDLARQGQGERSAMATFAMTLGLGLLAALAGGDSGAEAAMGMAYSANYFATLQILGYTRNQESAADQAAATFMDRAGQSGEGLVGFFDNFKYQEVFSDARRRDPYFRSHPLSADRIANLRDRVSKSASFNKPDSPAAVESHKIMVAKLKAFMNYPQQTYQDYPETDKSFAARYARAIARYKALDTNRALSEIDGLIAEQPENPFLWELKGQVLFESARIAEAEAPYRKAVELAPTESLLRLSLGQTLLALPDDKGLKDAIVNLNRAVDYEDENPFAWRLLSEAYERDNQAGLARLATAEQNFALGKLAEARTFALRARDLLEPDTVQLRRANDIIATSEDNYEARKKQRRR